MKKTSSSVALFFIIIYAIIPSFAEDKTEAPGITVISDAPQPSLMFMRFFYFLNQALIQWWQNEGRIAARGKWTIAVSEFYNEDMKPRGVTIIITRFDPPRRIMLNRQLTDGKTAADIIITFIKTEAGEDQK